MLRMLSTLKPQTYCGHEISERGVCEDSLEQPKDVAMLLSCSGQLNPVTDVVDEVFGAYSHHEKDRFSYYDK
jgi:hypothetical protein